MSGNAENRKADLEWERRVLCSDDACIGTIGTDGTCRECGRPFEGELPDGFDQNSDDEMVAGPGDDAESSVSEGSGEADAVDPEDEAADQVEDDQGDDDWNQRTLCSDGNCIGVIGPDGKCNECGKPLNG